MLWWKQKNSNSVLEKRISCNVSKWTEVFGIDIKYNLIIQVPWKSPWLFFLTQHTMVNEEMGYADIIVKCAGYPVSGSMCTFALCHLLEHIADFSLIE